MAQDKWTKVQSLFFGLASVFLIASIVIIVSIANVWSDKAVIITGIVLGLIDIVLWLKFWRHTTGFSNRHEDGGSSVK